MLLIHPGDAPAPRDPDERVAAGQSELRGTVQLAPGSCFGGRRGRGGRGGWGGGRRGRGRRGGRRRRRRWGRRRRRRRRRRWGRRWRRVVRERHQGGLRAVEHVLIAREVDRLVAPLPERI